MTTFKPLLSEKPQALEGAIEWADEELKRIKKEKEDAQIIYERIKPLRQEAFRKIHEREKLATK